jgi:hypothetical protein
MTTMNIIIALLNLPGQVPAETPEARTRRLLESGSRSSAIDTIDAWLQSPSAKKEWHMEPDAFAARLKVLVEAPYKLAQSGYPWCTYASVLMCLLRRAPSDVVDYALKLYNTGKIGLGRITGEVSSDLRDFDVARYLRRELSKKPPNGKTHYAQPVDFMLMAGLCSHEMNGLIEFDGPIDDFKAAPPIDDLTPTKNLMLASGLYSSVTVAKINPSDTDAAVQALIAPSSEQDILLVAPMSYFVDGLNFVPKFNKLGRHIVPVVRNDGTRLAFWSWGDEPITSLGMADDGGLAPPTLDGVTGGYSMGINIPELKKTVTDSKASRWIVTATLKPA